MLRIKLFNRLLILGLLPCAVGCFSETRTYSLAVHNDLTGPISVCMTKIHSSSEPGWESPEEMVLPPHPPSDETPPGVVIAPGKTLTSPPITGEFDREHGRAVLRVYLGTPSLDEMNAISVGSPNRLDVPLKVGHNHFEITTERNGQVTAVPTTMPTLPAVRS